MQENRHTTERLAELIGQKRQVLAQLRQVAFRQGELVDAGDAATLLKLLAAKQNLLSGLQKIEKALKPYRDQDPDARPWPTPEARAACAAEAKECATLLDEVVALEREHEAKMAAQRDRVAQQLRHAHSAHQAAGAYGKQAQRRAAQPAPVTNDQPATGGLDLTTGT